MGSYRSMGRRSELYKINGDLGGKVGFMRSMGKKNLLYEISEEDYIRCCNAQNANVP